MIGEVPLPPDRRVPLPPSPLRDELPRTRLVTDLARRFDVQVTVVVAGAGFGKTTALAQAIRANDAAPRGIDAWVACEPGDEDAGRFAGAILGALGRPRRGGTNLERVLQALRDASPVDVCLVIDDLHELPRGSAAEELLRDLAQRLPPHAHLLLASREPVPLPLARLRAGAQVVEVDAGALAFTETEMTTLAQDMGEDEGACDGLAGWPSLVRLVLSAPPGVTHQFLWEEIIGRLSPAERSGLLALAVLGSGTADDVARVGGCDAEVADRLVSTVPLLHRDGSGRLGAHQLWEDEVERIYPTADVREARRRALVVLRDRGETVRMGSAAARWGEADLFRVASVRLVRDSFGALPMETAARWLSTTPTAAVGTPEARLLTAAVRHARDHADDLDGELDAIAATFVAAGDDDAHAVTLALASVVAHGRGDTGRLLALADRVRALPDAGREPLLVFLVGAVDAALASLAGDVDGSIRIIEGMSFAGVPFPVLELVTRLHVVMLTLAGRSDEAVTIAAPLGRSGHALVRSMPPMIRWLAGDPSDYLARPPAPDDVPDANQRDRAVRAAHAIVVAASLGDRALADELEPELARLTTGPLDARDSAILAVTTACSRLLGHDEAGAQRAVADHVDRHPPTDRLGDAHLRRTPAVPYVCDGRLRAHWEATGLGPTQRRASAAARQLLAARAGVLGRRDELVPASTLLTALPLAWSVELAVRAAATGCADAPDRLRTLAAWRPGPVRAELAWLVEHADDEVCRNTAIGLLGALPAVDAPVLHLDVLGPLRLRAGAAVISRPELRRARVRTLLALLVLRGPVRRTRISELLWPDLDPATAAQNLRVTLSRLRTLLDPDRPAGQPTSRLRLEGDTIELARPPILHADLWALEDHLAEADAAHRRGDATEELAALTRADELWRGDPFPDLGAIDELAGDIEHVHRSLIDGCVRLGELLLVAGRFDAALRCAERCRTAAPYAERAHRLVVASQLQRQDRAGLEAAVSTAEAALAELGVAPEPTTQMLLRRARLGSGPRRPARARGEQQRVVQPSAAQATQVRVVGRASRRSNPIGPPQPADVP